MCIPNTCTWLLAEIWNVSFATFNAGFFNWQTASISSSPNEKVSLMPGLPTLARKLCTDVLFLLAEIAPVLAPCGKPSTHSIVQVSEGPTPERD